MINLSKKIGILLVMKWYRFINYFLFATKYFGQYLLFYFSTFIILQRIKELRVVVKAIKAKY